MRSYCFASARWLILLCVSVNHSEKLERFDGTNLWEQKMLFYLTTMNLARFLTANAPSLPEGETDVKVASVVDVCKHSDYLCQNYVMNA